MSDLLMFIDGRWRASVSGETFPVLNPATNEIIGNAPLGNESDVRLAVEAANRIQRDWGKTNAFFRGAILRRAAEIVNSRVDEIAAMMTLEQGKTIQESRQEVKKGAQILRFYAEEGERVCGRIIPNEADGCVSSVIYQPVGIAGAITPWNYPIELLAWKAGAAIASGCAIICKLPYETPFSPTYFAKCILEAGLPENALQILTGRGSVIGTALAGHPEVKRVAFTGSTAVGKQLAALCAPGLKHISLELGGSLPMLVFGDCDLEKAVKGCVRRSFRNNGQICIAINRVYVQRDVYERFLNLLVRQVEQLKIGDPSREDTDIGPMCTAKGLEKVIQHVEDARAHGARVLTGGAKPEGDAFRSGHFYAPTVLADATRDMLIMREETFGPAIGVMPFDSVEDAIEKANDSPYGLAAICYTNDMHIARKVANEVEAGNIAINNVDAGVLNAPYGGWKESGIGCEHGREGLFEYLRPKHIRTCFFHS